MKIEIDERQVAELIAAQVASPARIERLIEQRCQLVDAKEACAILKMGKNTFRSLNLPVVYFGDRKQRFRLSDIQRKVEEQTVTLARK